MSEIEGELAKVRAAMAGRSVWVITDGKAGDEMQCLGVAERLGLVAERRHVKPRALFAALMPRGPIDPAEAPDKPGSPLAPPFPDMAIASGRRAVAYLAALKKASGGKTFTAFLKDPRIGASAADFLWVPEHDKLRGENVLVTLTAPHRLTPEALAAARATPPEQIANLPGPRIALLIGGDSKDYRFTDADIARFREQAIALAANGVGLMATASRRTPQKLLSTIRNVVQAYGGFFWNGSGDNPYVPMLANADAVVVTAESTNMIGDAVATGKGVLLFTPTGGSPKIERFLTGLREIGAVRPFTGALETFNYSPIDATPAIAVALAHAYLSFENKRGGRP